MSDSSLLLEAKGVSKRFGGIQALRDVQLEVEKGTIHGLIGPNGAGKTTLFNVITGYLKADSGSVCFEGQEILGQPPYTTAQRGLVRTFQNVKQLGQMSVWDNMRSGTYRTSGGGKHRIPTSRRYARVLELLRQVGLAHKAQYRAASLSFGELRFLDVARALAADPQLLLLDEPAAGLNNEEVERLERLLLGMKGQDLTVVIIEHDVELVFRLCDRITVLDFGGVIATGTPEAVRRDPAVMAAYLGVEVEDSALTEVEPC